MPRRSEVAVGFEIMAAYGPMAFEYHFLVGFALYYLGQIAVSK